MSTHNLYLHVASKIRKLSIPPHPPVLLYKIGVQGDIPTFHTHIILMLTNPVAMVSLTVL